MFDFWERQQPKDRSTGRFPSRYLARRHLPRMTASPWRAASASFSVVPGASKHCALTVSPCVVAWYVGHILHYLSTTYPSMLFGVAAADADADAGAKRAKLEACASRSFCSTASARRLRKSDRWTSPTVWDFRRSSAVDPWEVNRVSGVRAGEESFDGKLSEAIWEYCKGGGEYEYVLVENNLWRISNTVSIMGTTVCNQANANTNKLRLQACTHTVLHVRSLQFHTILYLPNAWSSLQKAKEKSKSAYPKYTRNSIFKSTL